MWEDENMIEQRVIETKKYTKLEVNRDQGHLFKHETKKERMGMMWDDTNWLMFILENAE